MSQPTDLDEARKAEASETEAQKLFDSILEAAYQELLKMPLNPETADEYAAAECADGGQFDD